MLDTRVAGSFDADHLHNFMRNVIILRRSKRRKISSEFNAETTRHKQYCSKVLLTYNHFSNDFFSYCIHLRYRPILISRLTVHKTDQSIATVAYRSTRGGDRSATCQVIIFLFFPFPLGPPFNPHATPTHFARFNLR